MIWCGSGRTTHCAVPSPGRPDRHPPPGGVTALFASSLLYLPSLLTFADSCLSLISPVHFAVAFSTSSALFSSPAHYPSVAACRLRRFPSHRTHHRSATTRHATMTIPQFHGCAVINAYDPGRRRIYELIVRQEPKQARMCGVGGKGVFSFTPPVVLALGCPL